MAMMERDVTETRFTFSLETIIREWIKYMNNMKTMFFQDLVDNKQQWTATAESQELREANPVTAIVSALGLQVPARAGKRQQNLARFPN